MQKNWDSFWKKSDQSALKVTSWSKRRVLSVLELYLFGKNRVMDAGCGSGFYSSFFCEKGLETIALDYSDAALDLTRDCTSGRAQVLKADFLEQDLSVLIAGKVDLIFTDGLFEHFAQPQQDRIMQNFYSVLSNQGLIVTVVPNRWSPWQLIRPFMMPGINEQPFMLQGLMSLNQRNGLTVLSSGGMNTLPFRISPEGWFADWFGMLLYTVAKKIDT
jgi:SAM-dependent methyltransferase